MKQLLFSLILLMPMTGCLTGRAWDAAPGNEPIVQNLQDVSQLTVYVDGDIDLLRRALAEAKRGEINLEPAKRKDFQYISYPVIKVTVQKPNWDNLPTVVSTFLSGFTFSIIPGYLYQSSEVQFELTLPDKFGNLVITRFSYNAKRNYVTWLPLWVVGNYTQTVQTFTEPKLDWDNGYKKICRRFFSEAIPILQKYQLSQKVAGSDRTK